jgi:hypothetical protein
MKTLTETIDIAREELLTSKTKTVSEKTQLSLMKKTLAFISMFNGDHREVSNNCFDIITSCEKEHLNDVTISLLDRLQRSASMDNFANNFTTKF